MVVVMMYDDGIGDDDGDCGVMVMMALVMMVIVV